MLVIVVYFFDYCGCLRCVYYMFDLEMGWFVVKSCC